MARIKRLESMYRRRGFNGTTFAKEMGISRAMVSLYNNGRVIPSPSTLARLAEVLDTTIAVVFDAISKPTNGEVA